MIRLRVDIVGGCRKPDQVVDREPELSRSEFVSWSAVHNEVVIAYPSPQFNELFAVDVVQSRQAYVTPFGFDPVRPVSALSKGAAVTTHRLTVDSSTPHSRVAWLPT